MTVAATRNVLIGPLAAIPQGEGRAFDIAGTQLAVFRTRADAVYATQAACPHRGGPLADGLVGGTTVVCPLHARKFDLVSGAALSDTCDIQTYPARVTDTGDVLVEVPIAE